MKTKNSDWYIWKYLIITIIIIIITYYCYGRP